MRSQTVVNRVTKPVKDERIGKLPAQAGGPQALTVSAAADASPAPAIRMRFELDTDARADQVESLLRLTERYCVVYQTLRGGTKIDVTST